MAPFGDGVAILDLRSNKYFSLNAAGRLVFDAISRPLTRDQIVGHVATHYAIDPAVCAADIDRLLRDLEARRLVEMS